MDLNRIGLLKALTRRMDWLGERQRVLAENISNADTPGYRARDIKPVSFGELMRGSQLGITARATQPGHLRGLGGTANDQWKRTTTGAYETAPNGNTVNLEQQMISVAETQSDHSLMTSLYRKQVGMLRKALGNRQG